MDTRRLRPIDILTIGLTFIFFVLVGISIASNPDDKDEFLQRPIFRISIIIFGIYGIFYALFIVQKPSFNNEEEIDQSSS